MIQVFEQEKKDGLEDKISSSCSLALEVTPTVAIKTPIDTAFANLPNVSEIVKKIDLFYFESVLASVGWNKNDDVFTAEELWLARNTPVDKKINYMHDEKDIVGHMTASRVLDFEGKLVIDNTPTEQIPSAFDVVVGGFLYRYWEDDTLKARMNSIIESIGQYKIAVSMECIFPHFDYAVITPDGQHKVIARTQDTAFLTKHLRWYGGSGSYEGYKLGRVLRRMIFTGNALVDRPANPRSQIVKSEISEFLGTAASIDIFNTKVEKARMTISQEQYDSVLKRLETAEAVAKEVFTKELDSYKATTAALKADNDKLVTELATAKETSKKVSDELNVAKEIAKAHEDNVTKLNETIKTLEVQLAEAKAEMDKFNKETKKNKRKSAMAELDIDDARANELVEKFADVADELFDEVVKAMPKKTKTTATAQEILSTATVETTVTIPSQTQVELTAKASEWFAETLSNKNKKGE